MTRFAAYVVAMLILGMFFGAAVETSQSIAVQPVTPMVLSGADLGFRIEGMRGATPVGTLVVRVNGQWVPADFHAGTKPLSTR